MEYKRYKPKIDRLFWFILIPTLILLAAVTVLAVFAPSALWVIIPTDVFTVYFLITTLFGYAELREKCVFIKFGFFMKREIPYDSIYGTEKVRKFYSDSMLSLKNSIEHVNIKHDKFNLTSISVVGNDEFLAELDARRFSRDSTLN